MLTTAQIIEQVNSNIPKSDNGPIDWRLMTDWFVSLSTLVAAGGGGTDVNAIHKATAAEISAITEKTALVDDDVFLMEDSEDSFNKKKVKKSNIGGKNDLSSGVLTGGVLSTGAGATQYSISDGTGQVVDATGNVTQISWTGKTNITPTNIATQNITFVAIDNLGAVVESSTRFTNSQSRTHVILGVAIHVDRVNVDAVNNEQHVAYNAGTQLYDLFHAIGFFNVSGNVFGANGANMAIDKSIGTMFTGGSNYVNDTNNPHPLQLSALTQATFQYRYSDGSNGATGTNVDGDYLDDGAGGDTAVGNNKWSIQRIYSFTSNNVKIQRGVAEYASSDLAISSIQTEAYITEPSILANGLLRGWLVIKKGASVLNNTSSAIFIEAPKFQAGTGGVGALAQTMQDVYNNSSDPEILTTLIGGSVAKQVGSEGGQADTDLLDEWKNQAGTTVASVNGEGKFTGDGSALTGVASADRMATLENNVAVNTLRDSVNAGWTLLNMIDGIADEYEDETGIDNVASIDESYSASLDAYVATGASANLTLLISSDTLTETDAVVDSATAKVITKNGSVHHETDQKKWGDSSIEFTSASSDFLSTPAHSDFDFGGDDFKMHFWIRFKDLGGGAERGIYRQIDTNSIFTALDFDSDTGFRFISFNGTALVNFNEGASPGYAIDTWYHIHLSRIGNDFSIKRDGVEVASVTDGSSLWYSNSIDIEWGKSTILTPAYSDFFLDDIVIEKGIGTFDGVPTGPLLLSANNYTLISEDFTADAQPDYARVVFVFEDDIDTVTMNTDMVVAVSRDGGTTYTNATMTFDETFLDAKGIYTSGDIDISGQPAGTTMKYKITTANNKTGRVHATYLQWR